ncbi:MAG: hypothetical protein LBI49_14495 [Nocardiopsaceae bacterium]|nr:hypothetical protein [Nocardiopsaceae bacterium]
MASAVYGVARWRQARRSGRGGGHLLLLAPLGRSAASRLAAAMRQASWRPAAALPPLALIGYSLWRAGEHLLGHARAHGGAPGGSGRHRGQST